MWLLLCAFVRFPHFSIKVFQEQGGEPRAVVPYAHTSQHSRRQCFASWLMDWPLTQFAVKQAVR